MQVLRDLGADGERSCSPVRRRTAEASRRCRSLNWWGWQERSRSPRTVSGLRAELRGQSGSPASPLVGVHDRNAKAGAQCTLPKIDRFNRADSLRCKTSSDPDFCSRPGRCMTQDGFTQVIRGDLKLFVAPLAQQLGGLID